MRLRDELMTLLLAGHENGNGTLVGTVWIHYLPEVKTKLLAEGCRWMTGS